MNSLVFPERYFILVWELEAKLANKSCCFLGVQEDDDASTVSEHLRMGEVGHLHPFEIFNNHGEPLAVLDVNTWVTGLGGYGIVREGQVWQSGHMAGLGALEMANY